MNQDVLNRIARTAKTFFENARGSHDWSHTERVRRLCLAIGPKEGADLEVIELAALLHDIGRSEEDQARGEVCHAEIGARLAEPILVEAAIEPEKVRGIIHCIANHRFRGTAQPQTIEAKVLFDADKLDSIGAVGVGRAFLFAGEVGARLHNHEADLHRTRAYSKEDTAYREFFVKLRGIRDRMLTREGRRLAEERHEFMVRFFDRFRQEVEGRF